MLLQQDCGRNDDDKRSKFLGIPFTGIAVESAGMVVRNGRGPTNSGASTSSFWSGYRGFVEEQGLVTRIYVRRAGGRVGHDREGRRKRTYTWFSGRRTLSPRGVSDSRTLLYSQSLAAKPPTRTTC